MGSEHIQVNIHVCNLTHDLISLIWCQHEDRQMNEWTQGIMGTQMNRALHVCVTCRMTRAFSIDRSSDGNPSLFQISCSLSEHRKWRRSNSANQSIELLKPQPIRRRVKMYSYKFLKSLAVCLLIHMFLGCIPESTVNLPSVKPWTFGWLTQNLLTRGMLVPKTRPGVSSFNSEYVPG